MSNYINPTVIDFKNYFTRDFVYLPLEWSQTVTYNQGNTVYYSLTGLYYICLNNGVLNDPPTNTINWSLYAINVLDYVQDSDISRALNEVSLEINKNLFESQNVYTTAYLYFSAHILCINMMTSNKGLNSNYSWLLISKNVADVGASYSIPTYISNNMVFSTYAKTWYGVRYLEYVYTRARIASAFVVQGISNP
jgi:hypothetical protein